MSYAEQFFGVKEGEAREYADNLAWFGEDSYVYKNEALMKKILNSVTALQNPVSNEYVARWISDHQYDATDILQEGFTIGIYNSDLDRTIYFDAIKQFDDGSILYVTNKEQLAFIYSQTVTITETQLGTDLFGYDDFIGIAYLNSKKINWKTDYQGTDKYGQNYFNSSWAFSKWLASKPGFLHGLPKDTIQYLKPVESSAGDYVCLLLTETYIQEIADYARTHRTFFQSSMDVYNDYVEAINGGCLDIGLAHANEFILARTQGETTNFWVPVIKNLSSGTTFSWPRMRATVAGSGNYVTNAQVQAATAETIGTLLDDNSPVQFVNILAPKHFLIRI